MSRERDERNAGDAVLIRQAAEGDPTALETLYDRYARVVFSFAMRIVGDAQVAEEILQEAFFRAWQQGGSFEARRGAFVTWLLSITHNLAIDEVRRRNRRPQKADAAEPEQLLASVSDESQDVEEQVWLGSLRESIVAALAELPETQRIPIEMAYFQGLTQREIAERLDEPLGTIKTRMRLGLLKLRERMNGDQDDSVRAQEIDIA